nr:hypothetical protein [Dyadobacter sp. SG02]
MNITANLISGQVSGETAKQLSDRLGKIQQDRTALSLNRKDNQQISAVGTCLACLKSFFDELRGIRRNYRRQPRSNR